MEPHLRFLVSPADTTWVRRMDAACQAVEHFFGIELRTAHSGKKFGGTKKRIEAEAREKFFRRRLDKTKGRWFSLSNDRGRKRVGNTLTNVDSFSFGGSMYYGYESYSAGLVYPEQPCDRHEQLLVALGDALQARSSQYTPTQVAWRLRLAHFVSPIDASATTFGNLQDKTPEECKLPLIYECLYAGLSPLQPHHLGWINYWSQDVCDYIGFPERAKGSTLIQHCYRTPGGAWLVKLGSVPFEERNAEHMNILRAGYEMFPRIGVRVQAEQGGRPVLPDPFSSLTLHGPHILG